MPGIIGRKVGMTQIFDDQGRAVPVSIIQAGPCRVVQVKTLERDGYAAVQLGFLDAKPSRTTRPAMGRFRKAGVSPLRVLKEFRVEDPSSFQEGQTVDVGILEKAAKVHVQGRSKGKGFQGVVKRHGFSGGPKTHGSHSHRIPGSVGQCATPGLVIKGQKMPGQTGNAKVKMKNLRVVSMDPEKNLLVVRGAVPGAYRSIVFVEAAG
jgi:large subunit ribosomal protein L3